MRINKLDVEHVRSGRHIHTGGLKADDMPARSELKHGVLIFETGRFVSLIPPDRKKGGDEKKKQQQAQVKAAGDGGFCHFGLRVAL